MFFCATWMIFFQTHIHVQSVWYNWTQAITSLKRFLPYSDLNGYKDFTDLWCRICVYQSLTQWRCKADSINPLVFALGHILQNESAYCTSGAACNLVAMSCLSGQVIIYFAVTDQYCLVWHRKLICFLCFSRILYQYFFFDSNINQQSVILGNMFQTL